MDASFSFVYSRKKPNHDGDSPNVEEAIPVLIKVVNSWKIEFHFYFNEININDMFMC